MRGTRVTGLTAILTAVAGVAQAAVAIPAGMSVNLQLQQHVTSHYTPEGSEVFFLVADDVVIGGQTVIAKGTPVRGKVRQATERGHVGRAGMMSIEVRTVPAVDGTFVNLDLDLSKQGRSRGAATAGWIIFWGVPGLLTKGVNPFMERGSVVTATVLNETSVDPAKTTVAVASDVPAESGTLQIDGYQWAHVGKNGELTFDIERSADLGTLHLWTSPEMKDLELQGVDGQRLQETVKSEHADANGAWFDGWNVVKYCNEGPTTLAFTGTGADGRRYSGQYTLRIKIKKKTPKRAS